jgi:hypothetical protein
MTVSSRDVILPKMAAADCPVPSGQAGVDGGLMASRSAKPSFGDPARSHPRMADGGLPSDDEGY